MLDYDTSPCKCSAANNRQCCTGVPLCLQKSETEAAALEAAGPAAAAQAESLSAELAGAEGTLEALVAGTRGEVDALHAQLSKVR